MGSTAQIREQKGARPGMAGGRKVILAATASVSVAALLVLAKAAVFALSGSLSILASLTDSGLDLVASLTTFFAVRYASTPPDKEHPFGHGKAEAFSALFQAALVFASGALIMQDCINHLLHPHPIQATNLALIVLVFSVVLTIGLVVVQTRVLRDTSSVAISADRTHYMADLITNLIAIAGVGAAALGFGIMDTIAGFVMAGWFLWSAVAVLREASSHLMDRALEDDDVARIRELVLLDPAVRGLHQLRTRMAGPYVLIQMHMELDPALSLVEAHNIIIAAEDRLIAAWPNADILIHADPQGHAEPHGGVFSEGADVDSPVVPLRLRPDKTHSNQEA